MRAVVMGWCSIVVACGDNKPATSPGDAAGTAADAPVALVCDYSEPDPDPGTLMIAAGIGTICGRIDPGQESGDLLDVDIYALGGTTAKGYLVDFELSSFADIDDFAVSIDDVAELGPHPVYSASYNGTMSTHGAFLASTALVNLVADASGSAVLANPVDYKAHVAAIDPTTTCPIGSASYTEASDATNDVFEITASQGATGPMWTAIAGDTPEATGLAITTAGSFDIAGTTGGAPSNASYDGADTYAFTTGPATTDLTVRLDWQGGSGQLTYYVFEDGSDVELLGDSESLSEPELQTFAVKPSTSYWIWVGNSIHAPSTAPYNIALCGATSPL